MVVVEELALHDYLVPKFLLAAQVDVPVIVLVETEEIGEGGSVGEQPHGINTRGIALLPGSVVEVEGVLGSFRRCDTEFGPDAVC